MSPFEFVTVFYAVVLGLAVAHLMGAIGDLIEVRHRVRGYWVLYVWISNVFVVQAQLWWGTWDLLEHRWRVAEYFVMVTYYAVVYLATTLLLPRARDDEEPIDLRAHYYANRRPFFLAFTLLSLIAGVINVWLFATPLLSFATYIPAALAVISLIAAWTPRPAYHAACALVFAALYWLFLALDVSVLE